MGSTWLERLDALRDRFTLRALVAAGAATLAFVLLTLYGAVVLGTRVALPTLAFMPFWACLVALFLIMPWEWGGVEPRQPLGRWWGYWEGWVVWASLLGWARVHGKYLGFLADALDGSGSRYEESWESHLKAEQLRAFREDVLGSALMAEVGYVPFFYGVGLLLLVWWLLR